MGVEVIGKLRCYSSLIMTNVGRNALSNMYLKYYELVQWLQTNKERQSIGSVQKATSKIQNR